MDLIITHDDPDGIVSGSIVVGNITETYYEQKEKREQQFVSHTGITGYSGFTWNYGRGYDNICEFIDSNNVETIWMTDITLPDDFMSKYAERIRWFDHHKSSIEAEKEWKNRLLENGSRITVEGYRDMNGNQASQVAACELVFKTLNPDREIPDTVRYIGRYDVWDNTEDTFAYYEYFKSIENIEKKWLEPFFFKEEMMKQDLRKELEEGRNILKYKRIIYKEQSGKLVSETSIFGRKLLYANIGAINSTFFDSEVSKREKVDFLIAFSFSGWNSNWSVSCYSVKTESDALGFLKGLLQLIPDESVISLGGHKNACGCTIRNESIHFLLDVLGGKNELESNASS